MSLLFAAAAAAASTQPICADRPTKGNSVCTVPAGRFQLETATIDWTRIEAGRSTVETLLLGATVVKYGLGQRSDLQVGLMPYVHADIGGESIHGFGDVTVRYKQRLTGEASKIQAALIPFIKLPTAKRGIGNGKVEGGLAAPVSAPVGTASLTFGPEVDVLADTDGSYRHLGLANLVNLSVPIAARVTFAAELWSNLNFNPGETYKQASADAALGYAFSDNVQLDAGANFGLTHDTPDLELYLGMSLRR